MTKKQPTWSVFVSSLALAVAMSLLSATGAVAAPSSTVATTISSGAPSVTVTSLSGLEQELNYLATLDGQELQLAIEASMAAHEAGPVSSEPDKGGSVTPQALPAVPVIVWAIGCGFAGISSVATNAWSTANSAAWAIAGILVGCIPGVGQAAIVQVILANRGVIVNALKAVGLTAPALALSGDS